MKLLLTSCGFYTEEIKEKFFQLITCTPEEHKVAIITTASPLKEKNPFAQKAKKDFFTMGFQDLDFIDVELDSPDSLVNKDIIYINGGNPFYLLHHMKKSRADQIIRQMAMKNTVIVGASAGAVILGPHIKLVHFFTPQINVVQMNDFSALNLTEKIVFPHYDREDLFRDSTN